MGTHDAADPNAGGLVAKFQAAGPIETKVKMSTAVAATVGIVVAVLNGIVGNSALMGALPPWAQALILIVVPAVATGVGGYWAPPTDRPDVAEKNVQM